MERKNKTGQVHTAEAGKNDQESGSSSCTEEPLGYFSSVHLFIYWMLFGQLVMFLLKLLGYESLLPVIDWVSRVVPSVEELRHSQSVIADLARTHYALMWLFSPVLIIATLFSPVRQSDLFYIKRPSPLNKARACLAGILLAIGVYFLSPISNRTEALASFLIGFTFLSSVFSSVIALPFRMIKSSLN